MISKKPDSELQMASALRSARILRKQLENDDSRVALTINGGGGGRPVGEPAVAACVIDITSETFDESNKHFNDLVVDGGCDCSQPTQTDDGKWFVSCNCPD